MSYKQVSTLYRIGTTIDFITALEDRGSQQKTNIINWTLLENLFDFATPTAQLSMNNSIINEQLNNQWTTQLSMNNSIINEQLNNQWTTQLSMNNSIINEQLNNQWTAQ